MYPNKLTYRGPSFSEVAGYGFGSNPPGLLAEPEQKVFQNIIDGDERCLLSAVNAHETACVLRGRLGVLVVTRFWQWLIDNEVEIVQAETPASCLSVAEAVCRLGPKMWFNEATTAAGRDAIGFYHEKKDDARHVGLGPEHDWSSHAADALGLMAICYEEPARVPGFNRVLRYINQGYA